MASFGSTVYYNEISDRKKKANFLIVLKQELSKPASMYLKPHGSHMVPLNRAAVPVT